MVWDLATEPECDIFTQGTCFVIFYISVTAPYIIPNFWNDIFLVQIVNGRIAIVCMELKFEERIL